MPTLALADLGGPKDVCVRGAMLLDLRAPGRTPTHYRLARDAGDLPYAVWRPAPASVLDLPLLLPGHQQPSWATVAAEVQYDDLSIERVQAAQHVGSRGSGPNLPTVPAGHAPGAGYLARFTFTDEREWRVQQYNDTAPNPGNNFAPLDWSPVLDEAGQPTGAGYGWSSERTRAIDVGETPNDIIAAHVYARWVNPAINVWDFSPNTTRLHCKLAGVDLDLKGGAAYFAVVCVHPNGTRSRHHLYGSPGSPRQLAIGQGLGNWLTWDRVFPSSSSPDWVCSWASDGVGIPNMPSGPSFAIEAVEIVLRDFTAPPTGQLVIKELAIPQ